MLYENYLEAEKSEYAITLDEAFIYDYKTNGNSQISYVNKGESVPEDWILEKDKSFKRSFMVAES